MGRFSQQRGKQGEQIARLQLQLLGVEMLEKIATPVRVIDRKFIRLPGRRIKEWWCRIVWGEKVSGDWRGVMPGGCRVLAEVKFTENGRLTWSTFEDHQREALTQNHELGALSLVVWVTDYEPYVMRWPIIGLKPRKGIGIEEAKAQQLRPGDL